MDRDLLKDWLAHGLSLNEIGALTNRDPSTVGYWVQKFGLTANGRAKYAPRGGLAREQLEPLVERGLTLQQMADELDRSMSTIRHWMAKVRVESDTPTPSSRTRARGAPRRPDKVLEHLSVSRRDRIPRVPERPASLCAV